MEILQEPQSKQRRSTWGIKRPLAAHDSKKYKHKLYQTIKPSE